MGFYPATAEFSRGIWFPRQRWHEIRSISRHANAQLDQFMHALIWKAVPPIILVGIGAILLREFLRWLEHKATRAGHSWRAKRSARPSAVSARVNASTAAPHCPRGHGMMVMRTARRGENAGSNFWGCSEFPRCRKTQAV